MEFVQIALLLVIVILTILFVVLGIQVFFILREFRKTVDKANKVLDDTGIITESLSTPISTLSSLVMSIKTGISFANWLKKTYALLSQQILHKETKDSSEEKAKELNAETQASAPFSEERKSREAGSGSAKPMIRRFFRGIGKKIKL